MLLTGCTQFKSNTSNVLTTSRLRVITSGEGYFQISKRECENQGFNWDNRDEIGLIHAGEPYPFWFDKDQRSGTEYIRFYSAPNPLDVNLSENVFILLDQTMTVDSLINPILIADHSFDHPGLSFGEYTIHLEHQNLYLPQVKSEDHRLWTLLQPDRPVDLEFLLPAHPIDKLMIRFQIWNPAMESSNYDQEFLISINGQELTLKQKITSDWQKLEIFTDNLKIQDENNVQIQYVNPPEGIPLKLYLNSIEIEFITQIELGKIEQSFTFVEDPLIMNVLSSGSLIILDEDKLPVKVYTIQENGIFQIPNPGGKYATWIPEGGFARSLNLSPVNEMDGELMSEQIDYLIITPNKFQQSLIPFRVMREDQGMKLSVVSPQEIYDSINSGFPSPEAIKEYIKWVYENNDGNLKYVLLIGDYSLDIVNYDRFIEFVPTYFFESTTMGETISDSLYVDRSMDGYPNISIGRIPASTPDQLEFWIEKLMTYEHNLPGKWDQFTLVVDGSEPIYEQVANDFISSLQPEIKTDVLIEPDWQSLTAAFSEPNSLILYFGHGGINIWGKNQILAASKVYEFSDEISIPVILSFSCLNGYFIHPDTQSLAEALLFQPEGGSVALFTFTGQTLVTDQEEMITALQDTIVADHYATIGDLLNNSLESLSSNLSLDSDIVKSGIFFGDPSMRIP